MTCGDAERKLHHLTCVHDSFHLPLRYLERGQVFNGLVSFPAVCRHVIDTMGVSYRSASTSQRSRGSGSTMLSASARTPSAVTNGSATRMKRASLLRYATQRHLFPSLERGTVSCPSIYRVRHYEVAQYNCGFLRHPSSRAVIQIRR